MRFSRSTGWPACRFCSVSCGLKREQLGLVHDNKHHRKLCSRVNPPVSFRQNHLSYRCASSACIVTSFQIEIFGRACPFLNESGLRLGIHKFHDARARGARRNTLSCLPSVVVDHQHPQLAVLRPLPDGSSRFPRHRQGRPLAGSRRGIVRPAMLARSDNGGSGVGGEGSRAGAACCEEGWRGRGSAVGSSGGCTFHQGLRCGRRDKTVLLGCSRVNTCLVVNTVDSTISKSKAAFGCACL